MKQLHRCCSGDAISLRFTGFRWSNCAATLPEALSRETQTYSRSPRGSPTRRPIGKTQLDKKQWPSLYRMLTALGHVSPAPACRATRTLSLLRRSPRRVIQRQLGIGRVFSRHKSFAVVVCNPLAFHVRSEARFTGRQVAGFAGSRPTNRTNIVQRRVRHPDFLSQLNWRVCPQLNNRQGRIRRYD